MLQLKGVGYEVRMTGCETRTFGFSGVQREFELWLDAVQGTGDALVALSPEEALADLQAVEAMCKGGE